MTGTNSRASQKRQQQILLIGVVIIVVVAAFIVILATQSLSNQPVVQSGEQYAGIERSLTEEGWPRLGPADAPVTIHEYSAFTCSHCRRFHDETFPQLLEDIRVGRASFVFVSTLLNEFDYLGTIAAICALDQGAFWEMHDRIFADVPTLQAGAFSRERFVANAQEMGLDMEAFNNCLDAEETGQRVESVGSALGALAEQFPDLDITGTPTFTLNGIPPDFGSGAPVDTIGYLRQRIDELTAAGG